MTGFIYFSGLRGAALDGVVKDHSGEFCLQFDGDNGPMWSSHLPRYKLLLLFAINSSLTI